MLFLTLREEYMKKKKITTIDRMCISDSIVLAVTYISLSPELQSN